MLLKDKVAVITGSASGIGRGIAELFSEEGAKVALCDMNFAGAKSAASEISQKTGGKVVPVSVDITKKNKVEEAVEKIVKELGTIDILVNAAGIVRLSHA